MTWSGVDVLRRSIPEARFWRSVVVAAALLGVVALLLVGASLLMGQTIGWTGMEGAAPGRWDWPTGMTIYAYDDAGQVAAKSMIAPDGTYRLHTRPGRYRVAAVSPVCDPSFVRRQRILVLQGFHVRHDLRNDDLVICGSAW
jgi:hypothetical protein